MKIGPWDDAAFDTLKRWDSTWSAAVEKVTSNPWQGALDRKTAELISIAVNAACTNLNLDGTRRHIKRAIEAGATRDELLMVLKMASLLSIHVCSLGGAHPHRGGRGRRCIGKSEQRGNTSLRSNARRRAMERRLGWILRDRPGVDGSIHRLWFAVYAGDILNPKLAELLSIALDVSFTHMYAPGVRRHVRAALKLGATVDEIMDVFKLCVAQGVQAFNIGVPLLEHELE